METSSCLVRAAAPLGLPAGAVLGTSSLRRAAQALALQPGLRLEALRGTRIGLARWGGADNIGDWQADWHARLSDALARQQPVAAWVDPDRPERAVLERRPR